MSSHREAPEISKDPVADSTDLYAFVSPDKPSTVTIIANYIPLEAPGGRPELLRVRRRRALRDQHRQRRRRKRRHQLPVPVHDHGRGSEHLPLQHGPDHVAVVAELEPAPDLFGHPGRLQRTGSSHQERARHRRAVPAVQRRAPLDAELRRARRRPRSRRCRPARRSSPDSGPRASTSTWDRSSTSATSARSRISTSSRLRPLPGVDPLKSLNVHSIAIQIPIRAVTRDGSRAERRQRSERRHRRVDRGVPAQGPRDSARRRDVATAVDAGVAARQPAVQRGDRADGAQGRVERPAAVRRRPVRAST